MMLLEAKLSPLTRFYPCRVVTRGGGDLFAAMRLGLAFKGGDIISCKQEW